MAQLQKRKPARMELSPRVAQPPPRTTPSGGPAKRRTASPFGGMNRTKAPARLEPVKRPEAEARRPSYGKDKTKPKEKREGFHALKMQRALAPIGYGHRSAVKSKIQSLDSFEQFPLLDLIKESIASQAFPGLEDVVPTPVQRLALPALLGSDRKDCRAKSPSVSSQMEQFLLAAETGSGKTLAYLLPVIDAIKRAEIPEANEEAQEKARKKVAEELRKNEGDVFGLEPPPVSEPHPTAGRPRAIILVPTAELVDQVASLAKAFSHTVKFRAAPISAAYTGKVIRNRLFSPGGIDMLISTPHLLASIAESEPNVLSRVSYLVIDEADSLLDRSFSPLTSAIIDKSTPSLRQLIMCSATIPRSLDSYLRKRFPDIKRLVTPNLHAIPRRVQLGVVEVEKDPYRGNKDLACAETIWTIGKSAEEHGVSEDGSAKEKSDTKHIIVFVNEREKAAEVAQYLASKGIDAEALSRDTASLRQSPTLAAFTGTAHESNAASSATSAASVADRTPRGALPRRTLPNTKVLVTTDLGSRGIDTLAVRHVILYDVPHTTIDFIHRLGRTGRMGRRGRGIVLVGKNDRKDIVREVREGMFKGQALI
ncbi:RNA helicase [Coniosporium apollinis]|uniref:RNA helicase n=1 Tax=Coniosporium apollinis TaxID=61459 RepID=A0ABQ9NWZ6_9PEZI|nr:RNA helicase [Coniosporium apollinis]